LKAKILGLLAAGLLALASVTNAGAAKILPGYTSYYVVDRAETVTLVTQQDGVSMCRSDGSECSSTLALGAWEGFYVTNSGEHQAHYDLEVTP